MFVFSAVITLPACVATVRTGHVAFVYLVLLPSAFLVVVEHVFADVLPIAVVCRHMVYTLLQTLVSPPAGVEEQAQHQH